MQSRGAGVSGFLSAKSVGTPLPSKKAAVQTIFEFSQPSRGKATQATGQGDKALADLQCPPKQEPRPLPDGGHAAPADGKGLVGWSRLVCRQLGRQARSCALARRWLRLSALLEGRRRDVELERARRVPNKWLLLSSLGSDRAARAKGVARQWLRLAAASSARAGTEAWRAAEHSSALAAARRLADVVGGGKQGTPGPSRPWVSGSWDSWTPHEMHWSHVRRCYHFTVQQSGHGEDTFKIRSQDGSDFCVGFAKDKVWQLQDARAAKRGVVRTAGDDDAPHSFYTIVLSVDTGGAVKELDVCRLGQFAASPTRRYWISGTWDSWAAHEMIWNPDRHCFSFELEVGSTTKESFRVLVNGKRHLAWYPDVRDATFHAAHTIYGPDAAAHGRAWTIGAHALDAAVEGTRFEVRLRLQPSGSLLDVDWVRLRDEGPEDTAPGGADAEAAVRAYGQRLASALHSVGPGSPVRSTAQAAAAPRASETCRVVPAQPCLPAHCGARPAAARPSCVESDGGLPRCGHCGLPVGDLGYAAPDGVEGRVHGECLAQMLVQDVRRQDEARLQRDAALKRARRAEYGIGWRPERVPRSAGLAARLCCSPAPQGMCCLVLEPDSAGVRVAPTLEPAAAVNLAYLSVALAVRLREGREPFFSLDPLKATSHIPYPEPRMQAKRFLPHWLAGTSVGEVLFQADYHLKELSMGEYEQPVLGMQDCRGLSDSGPGEDWSGREWFVVRDAQVRVSEDGVLVPSVCMGVEARAQVSGSRGLEDAKITRPDHPLVRYAEAFSKNFDLIAERRSVIFHLRELARATVMAKFLVEAQVPLDEGWFGLADEELGPCTMEVPQLWNERLHDMEPLRVERGEVRGAAGPGGLGSRLHGVYGGVDLGLDRMQLAGLMAALPTAPRAEAMLVSRKPAPTAFSMIGGGLPAGRARMTPTLRAAIAPTVRAQGVDLDLGKFDLSSVAQFPGSLIGDAETLGASADPGHAFWSTLNTVDMPGLDKDSRVLLQDVFNPAMTDRISEGERFVPPSTCSSYLTNLRSLVTAEHELRCQREAHFLSAGFQVQDPGSLFPQSWRPSAGTAGPSLAVPKAGALVPLAAENSDSGKLQHALRPSALLFDRGVEDGTRFRIYRDDHTEVRTLQAQGAAELVGAAFTLRAPAPQTRGATGASAVAANERIVRATQYVERCVPPNRPGEQEGQEATLRYYAVLETQAGGRVSTEQLAGGQLAFDPSPEGLEERNAAARAIRSSACRGEGMRLGELQRRLAGWGSLRGPAPAQQGNYAQGVVELVGGQDS